jgi:hypothetical protein
MTVKKLVSKIDPYGLGRIYALNVIILITFFFLSYSLSDEGELFQSSGSIAIVISMMFEAKIIGVYIEGLRLIHHSQTMEMLSHHIPNIGSPIILGQRSGAKGKATKQVLDEMQTSASDSKNRLQRHVLANITIGTIVWGFGNYIYKFLFQLSQ